jgi:predicted amidohydrolase YtcJ
MMPTTSLIIRALQPVFVYIALCAALCAAEPADTIFSGGDIVTVDAKHPTAEAVAVRDGKIASVGSAADVMQQRGEATRVIDLAGRTLVPGFIDPHSHFCNALLVSNWANVSAPPVGPVKDIAGLVTALKQLQTRLHIAPGTWIVGWGYDPQTLKERRDLTRDDLDKAFPDNPVLILHVSLHGCVLNSAAFKKVGIDANTKTPPGGVIARKPGGNEPAGLLMETAFVPVYSAMPKPSAEELLADCQAAQQLYAQNGYTTIQDGATSLDEVALLRKAGAHDLLLLDVVSLPIFSIAQQVVGKSGYTFGKYDKRLKLGGIKCITDGSPQGKTAYWTLPLLTPGPEGQSMWRGAPNMNQEQLNEIYKLCYQNGVQVYSHANGDAAIDMVIAAHRAAAGNDKQDRRPVVIHSQFVRPDQLDEYVSLGMLPSFFTNHAFFWGDIHIQNLGYARASFLSPMSSAAKRGLRPTNHTDYIVTPLNALFTMHTAVNRITRSGEVLGPAERVAPLAALKAITLDAAYEYFEEATKGSIEVGKLADLVILDKNPLKVDRYQIKDIRVLATIKEGKTVHGAP